MSVISRAAPIFGFIGTLAGLMQLFFDINTTGEFVLNTIAGGLYPNNTKHLSYWIKSAPHMKPGSIMPSLGKGVTDPKTKMVVNVGGLTDAEVADIVAYLQALK